MTQELLFNALKHGDREHQEWLKEAITAFYDSKPIPPTRGGGNKEAKIKELEAKIKELENLIATWGTVFDPNKLLKPQDDDTLYPSHDFLRP